MKQAGVERLRLTADGVGVSRCNQRLAEKDDVEVCKDEK
jgi:hypothetical protein